MKGFGSFLAKSAGVRRVVKSMLHVQGMPGKKQNQILVWFLLNFSYSFEKGTLIVEISIGQ